MNSEPSVLVVHCVDTEGPIGGDVRRRPDGSAEFMDTWTDIRRSLGRLTSDAFRKTHSDSFGNPYILNWFIMDFTGFKTNPKERIAEYHDTYDHIKEMNTDLDAFYWHYHHPPDGGAGDQWSDDWDSSFEYWNILLHRLVEREDWPEAFRAGGTIEDAACSRWLEEHVMVDYSNRVSYRSQATDNVFDFSWFGAPDNWGVYRPSRDDPLVAGDMRRLVVRCVDLYSRLHILQEWEVREAFMRAKEFEKPVILSYFSHDHRDMNDETRYAINLLNSVSAETSVPWRSCQAVEAVQVHEGMEPIFLDADFEVRDEVLTVSFSGQLYQSFPAVGAKLLDDSLCWLPSARDSGYRYSVALPPGAKKITVGGTSSTGNKVVKSINVARERRVSASRRKARSVA